MTEAQSQPHQSLARLVQAIRSNASIALSHAGGATGIHTAYPPSPDLADLQADLSALSSASDRTPRMLFPPMDYSHPDVTRSFVSLPSGDPFQGNSQYCLVGRASNSFNYPNIARTSIDSRSVTSHPASQLDLEGQTAAPWTHLSATEGRTVTLSTHVGLGDYDKPQQLITPIRHRANSAASGQESFRDSAYGSRSGKSQHEVESMNELRADAMDQSSPLCQPSYFNPDHVPAYSSLPSSTAAPRTFIRNTESSESGHTTGLTPKRQGQKPAPLMCHECKYAAKNRSDLKKHNARHERQYRCHYTQCMRKAKGFATKNDLDRHLKSVHHENNRNTEYYRCFAEGCPRAARNWPRLDNFKQHLQKVHKHQDQDHLLKLSEQWYEQQQQRFAQEDGAESNNVDTLLPSGPVTPMMAAQEEYQNNCPAPEHPPDTSMTTDNQMARSLSFDHQLLDPSLVSSTSPGFSMPQRVHRRNVSNPNSASMLQRQFLNPSAYTDNLASSVATMQRTQSQLEYSNYSNDFLLTDSFDPMGNFHFSTGNPWPGYGPLTTMNHSFKYDAENDQIRRVKGPHTVAALESNSLAELTTPQEPPSAMSNDLSGRQEELLLNIGGSTDNTATGASSDTSPNQTFKVNLIPPENQTPIGKLLEDEINAFLLEHSSKSEKTRVSMSQEDIINLVRSSLRSLSTTNASGGGSSAGPSTASPASAGPASKKYPGHEKTAFRCTVEGCSKVLPRQSDLRKHLIRHEKPYGCTSDGCNKTFGSKNDWKRHEQTQHEQLECWLCVDCHEVFYYDQDNYIQHMREAHPVCHPQDGRYNVGQFQIAANHQGHYWCGFCNQIMRHNKHGVDAVNARFDHIGDHFNKDKKAPRSWIELTGRGRRKEESVQKPRDQSLSQVAQADSMRGEADSILSSSSSSSSSLSSSSFSFDGTSLAQDPTSSIPVIARIPEQQTEAQADMSCNTNTKTRAPEVRTQPHRRPQRRFRCADLIICCYCKAPSSLELSSACEDPSCLHKFCSRCTFKAAAATLKE